MRSTPSNTPASRASRWFAAVCLALLVLGGVGCHPEGSTGSLFGDMAGLWETEPTAREAAAMAFDPHDPDLRRQGVLLLASASHGGEPVYVRMYRLLLTDPDATVRAASIRALAVHGRPDVAEPIASLLEQDTNPIVRWEAAKALQRLHHDAAIGALQSAVQDDEDADVRTAAADALGQYPRNFVLQTLIGALHDSSFSVVEAARRSLHTLTGEQFGSNSVAWLNWADENAHRLFENQQQYTYRPYPEVPSLARRLQFWRNHEPAPRVPVGMTRLHAVE